MTVHRFLKKLGLVPSCEVAKEEQTYVEALLENSVREMEKSVGVMSRLADRARIVDNKIVAATQRLRGASASHLK